MQDDAPGAKRPAKGRLRRAMELLGIAVGTFVILVALLFLLARPRASEQVEAWHAAYTDPESAMCRCLPADASAKDVEASKRASAAWLKAAELVKAAKIGHPWPDVLELVDPIDTPLPATQVHALRSALDVQVRRSSTALAAVDAASHERGRVCWPLVRDDDVDALGISKQLAIDLSALHTGTTRACRFAACSALLDGRGDDVVKHVARVFALTATEEVSPCRWLDSPRTGLIFVQHRFDFVGWTLSRIRLNDAQLKRLDQVVAGVDLSHAAVELLDHTAAGLRGFALPVSWQVSTWWNIRLNEGSLTHFAIGTSDADVEAIEAFLTEARRVARLPIADAMRAVDDAARVVRTSPAWRGLQSSDNQQWHHGSGVFGPAQPGFWWRCRHPTASSMAGHFARHLAGNLTEVAAAVASQRAARAGIAIERYRLAHDRLPQGLEELVPDYLAQVPKDPFDGAALRFKRTSRGYRVYSVGHDVWLWRPLKEWAIDDGGLLRTERGEGSTYDTAFVLEPPAGWPRAVEEAAEAGP